MKRSRVDQNKNVGNRNVVNKTIINKENNNKGETLIEVVLSVALFSMTVLMAASLFFSAQRTSLVNYETDKKLDELLNASVKKESSTKQNITIQFLLDDTKRMNQSATLWETKVSDSMSLYQYSIQ